MQRFVTTKLFKVLLIALFFAGLMFLNPSRFFNPFRSGLAIIVSPFQKTFYSFSVGYENTREFISSIGQLKKQNAQLVKENLDLLSENAILQDAENENNLLRQQFDMLPRERFDLAAAFIVGQDPNGMGNWLEINKGSDDGLKIGMSVIISRGILIGRLQEVSTKTSKVILLTNPESNINVMASQSGAKGIARGEYGLGIIFDMILQTDSVQIGDSVLTSGVGGEIPKGLYIGKVQELHSSQDHLFRQAVVTAPLQIPKLQMAFVIIGSKPL